MIAGKIEIFLSYKEPEFKDSILWLRPYLDREGYELLYYGANGWTRFIPCHQEPFNSDCLRSKENIYKGIEPPFPIEDTPETLYEITHVGSPPVRKVTHGCPND